MIIDYILD